MPLLDADWAYSTIEEWERLAGRKATPEFACGFKCARNVKDQAEWQVGFDMGRMTDALIRALAANNISRGEAVP